MAWSVTWDSGVRPEAREAHSQLLELVEQSIEDGNPVPCLCDPQSFTADKAKDRATAVRACRRCPAIEPCGRFAELNREPFYVWGGRDRGPYVVDRRVVMRSRRVPDTPGDAADVRDHGSGF